MVSTCPSCGAESDPSARFCRRCGAQVGPGGPSTSPSEATTWTLDQSAQANVGTQSVLSAPTAPAYLSPQPQSYLAAPDTNSLAKKKNTAAIVLVLLVVILVAAGAGLLTFYLTQSRSTAVGSTGSGTSTEIPAPPQVPAVPKVPSAPQVPVPPVPPNPPAGGESGGSSTTEPTLESLRYPGSKPGLNVVAGGQGMIQLTTTDPAAKVVDWYSAKLHVTRKVATIVGMTILKSKSVSVIITPSGDGTTIMVSQGSDDSN